MTQAALRAAARSVLTARAVPGIENRDRGICTGGLVAAALTEIAGSSDVFDRGFVTYSNDAKHVVLDVPTAILKRYGAVSAETAAAMAQGALRYSLAEIAVAITGIAGPGGVSKQKPVGLVHFAAARRNGRRLARVERYGNIGRRQVRQRAVAEALQLLRLLAESKQR